MPQTAAPARDAPAQDALAQDAPAQAALAKAALAAAGAELADAAAVRRLFASAPPLRPLLVVGDSHGAFWSQGAVVDAGFMAAVVTRPAASARGLDRSGSRLGFGARIAALLDDLAAEPHLQALSVVCKFGQVDLEFVHPLKRLVVGQGDFRPAAFAGFLEETAARYAAWLRRRRERAPPGWRIFCQDLFPPSLSDARLAGRYVNFLLGLLHAGDEARGLERPLDYPDLAGRTAWHARFNALMDAALAGTGVERLRDFDLYLGPDGVVDPRCIPRTAGDDHHLDFAEPGMAPFIAAACARLEAQLAAPRA